MREGSGVHMSLKKNMLDASWFLIKSLLNVFPGLTDPAYDVRQAQRVAILSYGSKVGDSVIMTLFVRELKKRYPKMYLAVGVQENYKEIFERNPYIDQTFVLPDKPKALISCLRKNNFDVILDIPFSNRKNLLLYYFSAPKKLISVQHAAACRHITYLQPAKDKHFSDVFVQALDLFGIKEPDLSYDLFLNRAEADYAEDFLRKHHLADKNFVVFNPQASTFPRTLNKEKTRQILSALQAAGIAVVLLAHQADYAGPVFSHTPIFQSNCIMQTAALIQRAAYVLSVDTGIVHIADALGISMTVLYSDVCAKGEQPRAGSYIEVWRPKNSPFHMLRATWNVNDIEVADIVQSVKEHWKA